MQPVKRPSIHQLAKQFKVYKSVAERALKRLENLGWVTPVQGKGYFVSERRLVGSIPQNVTTSSLPERLVPWLDRYLANFQSLYSLLETHYYFVPVRLYSIETEILPRANGGLFPIDIAFAELEKKLANHGITTIYHALGIAENVMKKQLRNPDMMRRIILKPVE